MGLAGLADNGIEAMCRTLLQLAVHVLQRLRVGQLRCCILQVLDHLAVPVLLRVDHPRAAEA